MSANRAPIWRDAQRLLVLVGEAVLRFPSYHTRAGAIRGAEFLHIRRLAKRAELDQQGPPVGCGAFGHRTIGQLVEGHAQQWQRQLEQ